jgi:hypothetical protein
LWINPSGVTAFVTPFRIIADPLGMEIPMPEKVTVYRFDIYDAKADKMVRSKRWATREAIVWAKAHPLLDTAREIDQSLLGRLRA